MKKAGHLVPHFPPQLDGIGDYAACLGRELRDAHNIESRFIVGDPNWSGPPLYDGFPVAVVAEQEGAALAKAVGSIGTLIVHYVCYGYERRGVPFWINRGLRRWRQSGGKHCILMVHELWASGPPWKSEFYLGWIQRGLIAELHRAEKASVTSTEVMWQMLEDLGPGKTTLIPVPSSFPVLKPGAAARRTFDGPLRVLVFGQTSPRLLGIRAHAALLRALSAAGRLDRVLVAGKGAQNGESRSPDVEELLRHVPPAEIDVLGELETREVTSVFAGAHLFLSYYPASFLGKSTAFMSALACACPAVLSEGARASPLEAGRHFLVCDGTRESVRRFLEGLEDGMLERVSREGYEWYRTHADWKVAGSAFARLLEGIWSSADSGLHAANT
ncbi:MAG: glycosyltransferase [Verrucomicrobiota bacterium]|nr:glycosyltransferase [Verrucomicrobiota bacterium]